MRTIMSVVIVLLAVGTLFSESSYVENLPFPVNSENVVPVKMSDIAPGFGGHLLGATAIMCKYNAEYENTSAQRMSGLSTRQLNNAADLFEECVGSVVLLATDDGIGAGVIISKNEILTNYHVVNGFLAVQYLIWAPQYTTLRQIDSDRIMTAEVIAVDKTRDLAILSPIKQEFNSNQVISFGSSNRIRIAQDVFAIGHPEGLIWSFTYGVVSGLPTPHLWSYQDGLEYEANCIQTQTPINPGNSGGPLFDKDGTLIGINSMGMDAQGLNFAVRVDELSDFITKARAGVYPGGEEKQKVQFVEIVDHDFEGINKLLGMDVNEDGEYDVWAVFQDTDDNAEVMFFDMDYDLVIDAMLVVETELWFLDDNGDGEWDRKGLDTDKDFWPDEFTDL
jgi:S1-C subfamily serine protease